MTELVSCPHCGHSSEDSEVCSICHLSIGPDNTANAGGTNDEAELQPTQWVPRADGKRASGEASSLKPARQKQAKSRSDSTSSGKNVPTFRPTTRPPMAVLCVFDDGQSSFEQHRLRADATTVGRMNCDICIEHDGSMSGRHVTISRSYQDGVFRWFIEDHSSTNGTFLKINRGRWKEDSIVMIGRNRYQLKSNQGQVSGDSNSSSSSANNEAAPTKAFRVDRPPTTTATLIRVDHGNDLERYPVPETGGTIGTSADADMVLADDIFVSSIHCKIDRSDNRWYVEDMDSTNGVWIGVQRYELRKDTHFQLGEQRFRFRIF